MDINVLRCTSHTSTLQQAVASMFLKDDFKDVQFAVEGKIISCHKNILAMSGPYFERMFKSELTDCKYIEIKTISYKHFYEVVKFIYTGEIEFVSEDAQFLLQTADMMQFTALKTVMEDYFIEQMDTTNCLGFNNMAHILSAKQLQSESRKMMLQQFVEVVKEEEFKSLCIEDLMDYIDCPMLTCDTEDEICEAVRQWILHQPTERITYLGQLLGVIRVEYLSSDYIVQAFLYEEFFKNNHMECLDILKCVLKHLLFRTELPITHKYKIPRMKTRKVPVLLLLGKSSSENDGTTFLEYALYKDMSNIRIEKTVKLTMDNISKNSVFVIGDYMYIPFTNMKGLHAGMHKYNVNTEEISTIRLPTYHNHIVCTGTAQSDYGDICLALRLNKQKGDKLEFSCIDCYVVDKEMWLPSSSDKASVFNFSVKQNCYASIIYHDYLLVFGVSVDGSSFTRIVLFDIEGKSSTVMSLKLPEEMLNLQCTKYGENIFLYGSEKLLRLYIQMKCVNEFCATLFGVHSIGTRLACTKCSLENSGLKCPLGKPFIPQFVDNQMIVVSELNDKKQSVYSTPATSTLCGIADWKKIGDLSTQYDNFQMSVTMKFKR